jgi:hypothetical protein
MPQYVDLAPDRLAQTLIPLAFRWLMEAEMSADNNPTIAVEVVRDAVVSELMDYFSDPYSTHTNGLVLHEFEARHIADGIVQRAKQHHLSQCSP